MGRYPQSLETSLEKIGEALQTIALHMQPKVFGESIRVPNGEEDASKLTRWFNSETQQWELK